MAEDTDGIIIPIGVTERQFLQQMARIEARAAAAAHKAEQAFLQSNKGVAETFRKAEQSANVFGAEMDRLQRKFNPIYAASKRYEAAVEELNTAHRMGVVSAKQYEQALELLNADLQNPGRGMTGALDGASKSANGLNHNLGNIAAQFNDIGVTAAMGMNPMLIALQQGTQLSQVFAGQKLGDVAKGLRGAFLSVVSPVSLVTLGLVASVAALAQWGMAAVMAGNTGKKWEDQLDTLKTAIDDYASAAMDSRAPTDELTKKYGTAAAAARDFLAAISERELFEATRAMDDVLEQFLEGIDERVAGQGSQTVRRIAVRVGIDADDVRAFQRLQNELDLTEAGAAAATRALDALNKAASPQEQLTAVQAFVAALQSSLPPYAEMSDKQREIYDSVNEAGEALTNLVGIADNASASFADGAAMAADMADQLDRAVKNAARLAGSSFSNLRQAEIDLQFRTDPIGHARASAEEEWDSQYRDNNPAFAGVLNASLARERQEYIDTEVAAARLREEKQRLDEIDRENERLGRRKRDDPIAEFEAEIAALREQATAFREISEAGGDWRRELAIIAQTQTLMNEAMRAGILVTPEMENQIRQMAEAYVDARTELDTMQAASERGQSALEGMFGSIIDGSKSAKEAIGDLLLEIAKVQFVKGMMGLVGSTSWGGGLIDAIGSGLSYDTGGYTGPGGRYQPAGVVHKGEVVWSQDDVRRVGGPAAAEALRRHAGLPGYSEGGLVGMSAPDAALRVPVSTSRSTSIALSIDVTGARGNAEIAEMVEVGVSNGLARAAAVQERTFNARVRRANASGRKN